MPASSEERALLGRARAGDEDAFEQIVAVHADRVYGALRRFGLDPGEAEDVAQDVFLRAWRSIDRFEGRAQLSTWLYRIAFNEAQRRLARNTSAAQGADPASEERLRTVEGPASERPEARLEDRELAATARAGTRRASRRVARRGPAARSGGPLDRRGR